MYGVGYHPAEKESRVPIRKSVLARFVLVSLLFVPAALAAAPSQDLHGRVTHGYATSEGGVKIHYASLGEGPLVVMIHGFPDYWYTWRHQMEALSTTLPGRRDRPARLQPERQADRGRSTTTCVCSSGTSRP